MHDSNPSLQRLYPPEAPQRLDAILSSLDPRAEVQAMNTFSLFTLVKELGLSNAGSLVHLAAPEQAQAFLDFDCWNGDLVDPERFEQWLTVMLEGEDDWWSSLTDELDLDLVVLFLKRHLQIYLWNDEADARIIEQLECPLESTADGVYALVMPPDEHSAMLVRSMLQRLFAVDLELAHQLLDAARYELESVLNETAYGIRNGRMEEHGFLNAEESRALYAYVNPTRQRQIIEQPRPGSPDPSGILPRNRPFELAPPVARQLASLAVEARSYWGAAMMQAFDQAGSSSRIDTVLIQVANLVNQSIMADNLSPGNLEAIPSVLQRVHGFLNIGIEYASRRDPGRAVELVAQQPLRPLFQIGHSLALSLKQQAEKLMGRGNLSLVDQLKTSLCTDVEADLIGGLTHRRPLLSADRELPLSTLDELENAAKILALLAFKELWAFEVQGFTRHGLTQSLCVPEGAAISIERITFDSLLATRAALDLMGYGSPMRLLRIDEVAALVQQHLSPRGLSTAFDEMLRVAAGPPDWQARSAASAMTALHLGQIWAAQLSRILVEEYGSLTPAAFREPQFLPPLLLLVNGRP